jgi:hypothetical protein
MSMSFVRVGRVRWLRRLIATIDPVNVDHRSVCSSGHDSFSSSAMRTRRRLFSAIDFRKPPRQCSVHFDEPLGGWRGARAARSPPAHTMSVSDDGRRAHFYISSHDRRCGFPLGAYSRVSPFANCGRAVTRVRGSYGPEDLYGAIGVKAFRYGPSPCSAGLRHLLVPTCFLLGRCAERRSRVAEGHRGATRP